ncbi:MAG: response regulator transcription factor [Clostridia bacterium]|nr:MAG: response regulator transcription factor [Clostridia bacterium]
MDKIKILVVDDHEVVRLGLTSLFAQYPQFTVVGEAGSGAEALAKTGRLSPDVVIMDIRMPGEDGIEVCRELVEKFPGVQVVMLTSYDDQDLIMEAIMAGAKGYILKQVGNEELVRAVEVVVRGESVLDPVITKRLLERMRSRPETEEASELSTLTRQEKKVLALVAEGKTNREIARAIYLSEKTVRNYVSNILSKLNLSNRAEAAVYAVRHKRLLEG